MNPNREALESLLTHPGWHLWLAYVKTQWGPVPYARRIKAAVQAKDYDLVALLDKMNDELNTLLSWPADEVKRATQAETRDAEPPSLMRGGR